VIKFCSYNAGLFTLDRGIPAGNYALTIS